MKPKIVKKLRKFVRNLILDRNAQLRLLRIEQQRCIRLEETVKHLKRQLAPFGHVDILREPWIAPEIRQLRIAYDTRFVGEASGAMFERIVNQVRQELIRDFKL